MTSGRDARVPGHAAGHPALRRLVVDPDSFARNVWGRAALLTPGADLPGDVTDLFDESAVDELVSRRGLRTPFIRVAKDGTTLGERSYTSGAGAGAGIADQVDDSRLTALFADGATLVLQALHRTWPPLLDYAQQLTAELGHPVQVNAYVTPPQSRGFDDHYDVHDVFVLQVAGEKRWCIHEPVHASPLRDQPWTDRRRAVAAAAETPPLIDAVLAPGDCLYLPRGYLHAATALGDVSTHLTIGIHTWTRHTLAGTMLDRVLEHVAADADVRESLPLGVRFDHPADGVRDSLELVRTRLREEIDKMAPEEVLSALAERADSNGRPEPLGPLGQLRASQALGPDTTVVLRRHLAPRLVDRRDGARLVTRAGELELDPQEAEAFGPMLGGAALSVETLGSDLAQRLLRAGVIVSV